MKKNHMSVDGFVRRNPEGSLHSARQERPDLASRPSLHTGGEVHVAANQDAARPIHTDLGHADIGASLRSIDDAPVQSSLKARRRAAKAARPKPRRRKVIKWTLLTLLFIALGIGAYIGINAFIATDKIFDGNLFGLTQKQPLKQDANGRSNFIIFGTAEDDEGGEHGGANLTDSIMVLSVNQEKKDAYMISIPRDLWVEYGTACLSGYRGKINEVYGCFSNDGTDEPAGAAALQKKVGEILGLDIQYYVHLNFTAVVEAVDAIGGVEVTIESEDPRGILDRNFDWKCGYRCYYVNYKNGEKVQLDGEHALALARARNASGGYGLPGGNFDREKNQQKILKALREKALSAGTLTNLGKVTGLMNALGNNLRTNIDTAEIQTAMTVASETSSEAITSLSLVDEEHPLVTTGMIGTVSTVYPIAGTFNYSAIKTYIAKQLTSDPVTKEGAQIIVLNGTGSSGVAGREAEQLEAKGYTIEAISDAPKGTYAAVEIYQIGEGNAATAAALKQRYAVSSFKTGTPPIAVSATTAFVVVIGQVRDDQ